MALPEAEEPKPEEEAQPEAVVVAAAEEEEEEEAGEFSRPGVLEDWMQRINLDLCGHHHLIER